MANTTKGLSERDYQQTLKGSFNDVDSSLTTGGFLVGKVGRKISPTILTTTVTNDTVNYEYAEDDTVLYTIQCVYTDGTRAVLISATRIS